MTDQTVETEIQAKGLTAPRVTPEDVQNAITGECFFSPGAVIAMTYPDAQIHPSLYCLTICVLVLANGYTVTGESACASPENFDAGLGQKIARENAVAKIWPLLGYELRTRLATAVEVAE